MPIGLYTRKGLDENIIADNKKVDTWLKTDTCKKNISVWVISSRLLIG